MVLREKPKSHAIENAWKQLKRELHYTDRQMFKNFPDLSNALEEEIESNEYIKVSNLYKLHLFKRYGYYKN